MSRLDELPSHPLTGGLTLSRADTRRRRALGLAGLASMPSTSALHLPRCRSVHTFGMRFALDLIWLDASGRPVRVDRAVRPGRMRSCLKARSVVEVNAGEADAFLAAGLGPR